MAWLGLFNIIDHVALFYSFMTWSRILFDCTVGIGYVLYLLGIIMAWLWLFYIINHLALFDPYGTRSRILVDCTVGTGYILYLLFQCLLYIVIVLVYFHFNNCIG